MSITHRFGGGKPATPTPMVQLVIAAEGILLGTFLDESERAQDFARQDGAVVVELPVTHDFRGEVEL